MCFYTLPHDSGRVLWFMLAVCVSVCLGEQIGIYVAADYGQFQCILIGFMPLATQSVLFCGKIFSYKALF